MRAHSSHQSGLMGRNKRSYGVCPGLRVCYATRARIDEAAVVGSWPYSWYEYAGRGRAWEGLGRGKGIRAMCSRDKRAVLGIYSPKLMRWG